MDWLLKAVVIWLCIDVVVIATGWYAAAAIRRQFPRWWRQTIVDDLPKSEPTPDSLAARHTHSITPETPA